MQPASEITLSTKSPHAANERIALSSIKHPTNGRPQLGFAMAFHGHFLATLLVAPARFGQRARHTHASFNPAPRTERNALPFAVSRYGDTD
jgi:hypothetical protein